MKILLVSGPGISLKEPYNSGIEAFMVSFASELVHEGHTVDVVAEEAPDHVLFNVVNPFDAVMTKMPLSFQRLEQQRQFKSLKAGDYDIIHYQMFYPHLIIAGFHFNKPLIVTLHSPADKKRISAYKKLSKQKKIFFIAISERIKCRWDEALGTNMLLIANGINLDHWPTKSSADRKYLLWAARINEEKNAAAAIHLARHMQLPLRIAGRIADQRYFDQKVKPHLNDQIQYVGHLTQRELSSLAKKASVYLATAIWQEPFGLAALEMLASGLPVVGFTTAVPPEWKHDSILTTSSLHWQDLEDLIRKSDSIDPDTCKAFASDMNIQNMTSNYLRLYEDLPLQDIAKNPVFNDAFGSWAVAQQSEI